MSRPVVWVFDPYDGDTQGVARAAISDDEQLEAVIREILERVERAARPLDCVR